MTTPQALATAGELRGAGLRVTAVRVALLETVRDGDHLGVEAIASGVRDRVGHVSLQAVYDALDASGTTTTTWCAGRAVSSRTSTARWARRPA